MQPRQGIRRAVEERVSCVYWHMHDRRMYQRGAVKVVVARQVGERLKARMGYSGYSGGGAFLSRILVYEGEEGQLSETGWIIVK
eukprot:scaffold36966_cov81-Attheya_sp.AAC.1